MWYTLFKIFLQGKENVVMRACACKSYDRSATQGKSAFSFCAVLMTGIAAAISAFAFLGVLSLIIVGGVISVIILSIMTGIVIRKTEYPAMLN